PAPQLVAGRLWVASGRPAQPAQGANDQASAPDERSHAVRHLNHRSERGHAVPRPRPYDRAEDPTRPDGEQTSWDSPLRLVAIYAPTRALPYYRIVWGIPQEGTTVGRYFERAWGKALAREQLIVAGATPKTEQTTSVGTDYWLAPERPKPR